MDPAHHLLRSIPHIESTGLQQWFLNRASALKSPKFGCTPQAAAELHVLLDHLPLSSISLWATRSTTCLSTALLVWKKIWMTQNITPVGHHLVVASCPGPASGLAWSPGKGLTVRTQQPCITSRTTKCLPIAVLVRASQHHWHHLGQWQDQAKKWSQSIESATSFEMLLGTKNCTTSIGKSRSSAKLLRQHVSLTKAFHWSSISFWPEG